MTKTTTDLPVGDLHEDPPVLSTFVIGKTNFQSSGYSEIKITEGGEEKRMRLPIKSIGIIELQNDLRKNAPKPPVRMKKVFRGSSEAQDLGITESQVIQYFDTTDTDYLDKYAQYRIDFLWMTVVHALDILWKDTEGNDIKDFMVIKEGLTKSGITGHHLDQIFDDVEKLTKLNEEKADFLSAKQWV